MNDSTPSYQRSNPPSARKGMGFRLSEHGGRVIPALSLTQPWAECILGAEKDIENRTWPTDYRGPLWLHAAKTMRREDYYGALKLAGSINPEVDLPALKQVVRSAIVGLTWVVGCAFNGPRGSSPWEFIGQYGWELDLTRTWRLGEPLPATGALGLWRLTDDETATCRARLPSVALMALNQWEDASL